MKTQLSKERTALAFAIALPLIVLVGFIKPDTLTASKDLSRIRFWTLKVQRTDKFDLVLVGDSRTYTGLSPETMQTVLSEMHFLNFAFSSGGLNPEIYKLVEQRLAPNSLQPVIVVDITPLSLTPDTIKNEQYHQFNAKTKFETFLILHFTPILEFLQPLSIKAISDRLSGMREGQENIIIREYHDDGWVASWYLWDDPNSALKVYDSIFEDNRVSEQLVQALIDQTQQWSRAGILVFGYRPPTTQQMIALENQLSGFDEAAVRAAFETAGGIWIEVPADAYVSYDGSHLHKDSAIEFSVDLAEIIKPYLTDSDE